MADIKDINSKQEGSIATFEFPDRIKDFEKFKEHLLAILHVNTQVFVAETSRGSGKIKVKITGRSEDLDLGNFRNIISGIAKRY